MEGIIILLILFDCIAVVNTYMYSPRPNQQINFSCTLDERSFGI